MSDEERALIQEARTMLGHLIGNSKYGYQRRYIAMLAKLDATFDTHGHVGGEDGQKAKVIIEAYDAYRAGNLPVPY